MATGSGLVYGPQGQTPASLLALAGYLELSLDEGKCVVMMRRDTEVCSVYIGHVTGEDDELAGCGAIAAAVADEILELTLAGVNRITVGEETYRFVRSFTHIGDVGAVVFAPA